MGWPWITRYDTITHTHNLAGPYPAYHHRHHHHPTNNNNIIIITTTTKYDCQCQS